MSSREEVLEVFDDAAPAPAPTGSAAYRMRPYQVAAKNEIAAGWRLDIEGVPVTTQLACMATGTGKTVLFSSLAADEAARGGKVLILAHTDELIDQAIAKFTGSTGMKAAKEKAHSYASRWDKVVVGSVQTMCGLARLSSWTEKHFSLVIVDEAHRSLAASYQTILKKFCTVGGAKCVGVTATADRGDKRALGDWYQRVACDYGLLKAVRDGWLVRPMVKTMPLSIDLRGVHKTNTSDGSDLDRAEVGKRLVPIMAAIASAIKAQIGAKKILLFLPSVETATMLSDALNAAGVSANWVCGDKKICGDRGQRVADHKAGKFQALCNMAVLTEGYDDDTIDYICCLRATTIRSLYCQIIGRGTRPHNSIVQALNRAANAWDRLQIIKGSCKPHLTILDFLYLYEKHDLCRPASLLTEDVRVVGMTALDGDLIEAEAKAERDLLAKLEKDLRKNANRKATVVDPLAIGASLHDLALTDYQPENARDERPVTDKQRAFLASQAVDASKVKFGGHANLLIGKILQRQKLGLTTIRQLNFFGRLGIDVSGMTIKAASALTDDKAKFSQMCSEAKQRRLREAAAELASQEFVELPV